MKIELRRQARSLASELDWFAVQTPVAKSIRHKDDEAAIDRVVRLLYDLSKTKSRK